MFFHQKIIIGLTIAATMALSPVPFIQQSVAHAENQSADGSIEVVRTGDSVEVIWEISPEFSDVQVFEDNEVIAGGDSSGDVQVESTDTEEHTYQVVATRGLTDLELEEVNASSATDFADPGQLETVAIIGTILGTQADYGLNEVANATSAATSTTFRYQTFIEDKWISAPPAGCGKYTNLDHYKFKGDNRSFMATSNDYRTRFDTLINWPNTSITSSRSVGMTSVYQTTVDGNILIDQATAPKTSMKLTPKSATSTLAKFNITQNVADPFCASNGIFVDLDVSINRNGNYYLTGQRLQAPDHEVYIKDSDETSWAVILRAQPLNMMICLTPTYLGVMDCVQNMTKTGTH